MRKRGAVASFVGTKRHPLGMRKAERVNYLESAIFAADFREGKSKGKSSEPGAICRTRRKNVPPYFFPDDSADSALSRYDHCMHRRTSLQRFKC